jgi:hypothetical protein
MSPIALTIFVGTSSASFKCRMTIPLFRPELCGRVGRPAMRPLTRVGRRGPESVDLDKRVSELPSVPYVTLRPRLSILRLRISAPDPDNKLDEIPPFLFVTSESRSSDILIQSILAVSLVAIIPCHALRDQSIYIRGRMSAQCLGDSKLLRHVLPNFRQQFARAVRLRYIVIAAGHSRLLSFTAERIRRDCDDRD